MCVSSIFVYLIISDLSYNTIRGSFPAALLALTSITNITLTGNNLSGSIPAPPSSVTTLYVCQYTVDV